jgi:hypothetical protein
LYDVDELTPFAVEYRYDIFTPASNEMFSRRGALESVKIMHRWILSQVEIS